MSSEASTSTALPRNDFFQSDENFTVSVYVRNLQPQDVTVAFRERALKITVPDATYDVSPLSHAIDTDRSTYRVSKVKLELILRKKDVGIKWSSLTGEGEGDRGLSAAAPVASTSTSQKKHKDWSQAADAALTASTDPSAKDEGDVNDFFKKLYADLDDDGRKAMMKSMSESNGTSLSTDWSSISKQRTKVEPPQGMEVRQHGK